MSDNAQKPQVVTLPIVGASAVALESAATDGLQWEPTREAVSGLAAFTPFRRSNRHGALGLVIDNCSAGVFGLAEGKPEVCEPRVVGTAFAQHQAEQREAAGRKALQVGQRLGRHRLIASATERSPYPQMELAGEALQAYYYFNENDPHMVTAGMTLWPFWGRAKALHHEGKNAFGFVERLYEKALPFWRRVAGNRAVSRLPNPHLPLESRLEEALYSDHWTRYRAQWDVEDGLYPLRTRSPGFSTDEAFEVELARLGGQPGPLRWQYLDDSGSVVELQITEVYRRQKVTVTVDGPGKASVTHEFDPTAAEHGPLQRHAGMIAAWVRGATFPHHGPSVTSALPRSPAFPVASAMPPLRAEDASSALEERLLDLYHRYSRREISFGTFASGLERANGEFRPFQRWVQDPNTSRQELVTVSRVFHEEGILEVMEGPNGLSDIISRSFPLIQLRAQGLREEVVARAFFARVNAVRGSAR